MAAYFRVYDLVAAAVPSEESDPRAKLTHSDLKDIATTIFLSFKEGYITRMPHFRPSPSTEKTDALLQQSQAVTQQLNDPSMIHWKDFCYVNGQGKSIRLGDKTEKELRDLKAWCDSNSMDTEEKRAVAKQVSLAVAEFDAGTVSYRTDMADDEIPF